VIHSGHMTDTDPLADKFAKQGQCKDLHDYQQQLKVAAHMEKDATFRLHEKLRRQCGTLQANAMLRKKSKQRNRGEASTPETETPQATAKAPHRGEIN